MRKFLILLGILFFLGILTQAAETTWRHSGSEVTGFDYNFTNKYSINNVLWINGTNLNVSDVRQDLNFNNKNISQVELVNGVNFTDLAQRCPEIVCINNIAGTIIVSNRSTGIFYRAVNITDALNYSISNSQSNSTIKVINAKYTPTEQVRINKSLNFEFDSTEFIWLTSDANVPFLNITGLKIGTTTLSSDVPAGEAKVTVASTTGINTDDLIIIWDNHDWGSPDYAGLLTGEIHKVYSVSGSDILIRDSFINNFTASNGGTVEIIRPIKVSISGIQITGSSPTSNSVLIRFNRTTDSSIYNSVLKNGYYGVYIVDSYNTDAYNNQFSNFVNTGTGYGVIVGDAAAYSNIYNNRFSNNRHGTASGGSAIMGQPRGYNVHDNIFENANVGSLSTAQAIDSHSITESAYIKNNIIYSALTTTSGGYYGISLGAKINEVEGNTIYNGFGINLRNDVENASIVIQNNKLYNASYLFRYATDTGGASDRLKYIKISNNVLIGNNTIGIDIRGNNNTFDISDNYIEWYGNNLPLTAASAIFLKRLQNGKVTDNTLVNPVGHGIQVNIVNDTVFSGNTIIRSGNKRGNTYESLWLNSANNNTVSENTIEISVGGRAIRNSGNYNIIYQNKLNVTAPAAAFLDNGIRTAKYNNYGVQGFYWGVNSTMNGANNFSAFGAGDTFFNATTVAGGTAVNGMCVALAAGEVSWAFTGNNTIGC